MKVAKYSKLLPAKTARTPKAAPVKVLTTKPETLRQWAERYCKERGHDLAFAEKNGAVLASSLNSHGYKPMQPGIIYPCIHPTEDRDLGTGRIRYQSPPLDAKGKPTKFKQRAGTNLNPYFACTLDWRKAFKDPKIPLIVSEGETRALAVPRMLPCHRLGRRRGWLRGRDKSR